jgi:hypothetical protein
METTDNPLDGALEIGAGRSATVVRPGKDEQLHAGGVLYSVKACGPGTAQAYWMRVVPADHLVRQIDDLLDLSWVHKADQTNKRTDLDHSPAYPSGAAPADDP